MITRVAILWIFLVLVARPSLAAQTYAIYGYPGRECGRSYPYTFMETLPADVEDIQELECVLTHERWLGRSITFLTRVVFC